MLKYFKWKKFLLTLNWVIWILITWIKVLEFYRVLMILALDINSVDVVLIFTVLLNMSGHKKHRRIPCVAERY